MLIFSENFKHFVKFFNNSAKIIEQKIVLPEIDSNAKILSKPNAKTNSNGTSKNL